MSSLKATSSSPAAPSLGRNVELSPAELNPTKQEGLQRKREEAEKVAQEFETMFMDMMVKSMRQTAQREDVSNAEDIYQGMLDSEYSKSMTATQSFGIRTQILNWLEQTDPDLRTMTNDKSIGSSEKGSQPDPKLDAKSLLNESMALKAATQAYRMSSTQR
ncbi:MAG: hypothetical protein RI932_855 [Pseudomonadota bacterium]|jgi:flagellar protein FlgJ